MSKASYEEVMRYVIETKNASISRIQRKFIIGYNLAAEFVDRMEREGVVSGFGKDGRKVLK